MPRRLTRKEAKREYDNRQINTVYQQDLTFENWLLVSAIILVNDDGYNEYSSSESYSSSYVSDSYSSYDSYSSSCSSSSSCD